MTAAPAVHDLLVTAEGYDRLCSELETLRSEGRRAMSDRLREARADGNLEDNPELFDLLEEQDQLERRIATLEARLAAARVAESNGDGSVGIGSPARLRDLETSELFEYEVVGSIEGDVGQGSVSVDAPVGRALLGTAARDIVTVACPRGELRFEVMSVIGAERRAREAA
ncbi:MAG: GreA/GreB family elongation factor [Gaiellaceae bacterium]